jgi:hypothetical protein
MDEDKMGKTILTGLMVGVAAGALTAGFASTANAGAIAYSSLQISNFIVSDSAGNQFSPTDFALAIGNFTKAEAALNGSGNISNHPSDVSLQCFGDCGGIGQNDFAEQGGAIGQFARGDAILTGSAVTEGGANSSTVAEVQLNQPSTNGVAGSNTGTTTEFSFTLPESQTLTFSFDALGMLHALLEEADEEAFASIGWSLSIAEADTGAGVFSFAPDCINASRGVVNAGEQTYTCDDSFSSTTGLLLAGVDYLLTINHESAANAGLLEAPQVPEPEAAALLGLGLLGVAAYRRRSRKA